MSDKEKIKEEIERRIKEISDICDGVIMVETISVEYNTLCNIRDYINSLQEEHNEDLEEEIQRAYYDKSLYDADNLDRQDFNNIARHFAEWQKQNMKETLQTEYEKGRFDMREEMIKALVDGEIMKNLNNQLCMKSEPIKDTFGDLKFGDKVKIIILKTE